MKVLLSIRPEFVQRIFSGVKQYEYRKSMFRNSAVESVIVYATKPVGMIVGEFKIDRILQDDKEIIWNVTKQASGITYEYYRQYYRERRTAVAIKIINPVRFVPPIVPTDVIMTFRAPQSFAYIHEGCLGCLDGIERVYPEHYDIL